MDDVLMLNAYRVLRDHQKLRSPTASFLARHMGISWYQAHDILDRMALKKLIPYNYDLRTLLRFTSTHKQRTSN